MKRFNSFVDLQITSKKMIINWGGYFNFFLLTTTFFPQGTAFTRYVNKLLSSIIHFLKVLMLYYTLFPDKPYTKNYKFWIGFSALDRGFRISFNWVKLLSKNFLACCRWFCVVSVGFGWLWLILVGCWWFYVVFTRFGRSWLFLCCCE